MSRDRKLPAVPAISSKVPREIAQVLSPLKQIVEALQQGGIVSASSTATGGSAGAGSALPETVVDALIDSTIPPAPTGVAAQGGMALIIVSFDKPGYRNHAYTEVWRADSNDFSQAVLVGTTQSTVYTDSIGGSRVAWYWLRHVSTSTPPRIGPFNSQTGTRGETGMDASYLQQVLAGKITENQLALGSVNVGQIIAGAVDITKFASGIRPTRVVAVLPSLPAAGWQNGDTAALTTDGKLYRIVGGAWRKDVDAADIAGQVTNAQIAGLAASKVTGQLTDAQIAAVAAAKLTGQITTAQIADGSISGTKFASGIEPVGIITAASLPTVKSTSTIIWNNQLYRWNGAAYAKDVSAADISGQVQAAQLAGIEAGKVTGQLTDAQIAAVAAAKLTGQIATAQIAANAIDQSKLAADMEVPKQVSTLPVTHQGTDLLVLTTDRKLYRWNGTAYVSTTAAADITGQLAASQVSALEASKITGQLTDSQLAAISAAKVSGQLASSQLADGAITAAKIAAGVIDQTKLAADMEVPKQVSVLPSAYQGTDLLVLTTDRKLYRWNGTAYVSSTAAADITGQLAASQVSALEASKITGQLTDSQLAAISAAKLTGQIAGAQLAAGAVSSDKLSIEIGGGNLCLNSSFEGALWYLYNNSGNGTLRRDTGRLTGYCHVAVTGSTVGGTLGATGYMVSGGWQTAQYYIISFYAKKANGANMQGCTLAWNYGPTLQNVISNPNLTTEWQRYVFKIRWNAGSAVPNANGKGSLWITSIGTRVEGDEIWIDDVQVEAGDVVTAYAPKPDEILPGTITATEISDSAITTPKLAAGAVVAGKIAANAISATEIQSGAITTVKLAAGAVTANEIAASTITGAKVAADTITGANIAAGAITASKIAAATITATELAAGSVTTAKLVAGAVTASELAAGAVVAGKIAANAVTANELAANAVVAGKVAAGAISASEIAASAITTAHIAAGQVTTAKLAAAAVTANELAAGAVVAGKIAAGAVTATELAAGAVTTAKLAAGSVDALSIAAGAVVAGKIAASAVTANELAANAVTAGKIQAGAITATAIAAGSITASKLAIADLTNAVLNPEFAYGGTSSTDSWAGNVTAIAASNASVPTGAPSRFVASLAVLSSGANDATANNYIPVAPGEQYYLEIWCASDAAANRIAQLMVSWNDAEKSTVSWSAVATRSAPNQTWSKISGVLTVPALVNGKPTAFMRFMFSTRGSSGGTGTWYFAKPVLRKAASAELIVDGAITTAKLAAAAVTANELAAGAVVAGKIAANAVTANELAAGAVTTAKLAAGSVDALSIAAGAVVAGKIAASAVTANELAANSVTTAKIQAGAIGAAQIAAGAITADKLLVMQNPMTITSDPSLQDTSDWSIPAPASVVTVSGLPIGNKAILAGATVTHIFSRMVPIDQSKTYLASAWANSSNSTKTVYLLVAFYDASGALMSGQGTGWNLGIYNYFGLVNQVPTPGWNEYRISFGSGGTASIPAGARFVRIGASLNYNNSATGDIWIGGMRIQQVSDGTLIANGAVTTDKVAANAVTTAKLAAGAVTANELAAGSVIASKIASLSVQAQHIQAGAIVADKLAAGAVTAATIQAGIIQSSHLAAQSVTADKLNVASLSAVTANIGLLRTATSGARMEIENNQLRVYDANNVLRVRLGVWQ